MRKKTKPTRGGSPAATMATPADKPFSGDGPRKAQKLIPARPDAVLDSGDDRKVKPAAGI